MRKNFKGKESKRTDQEGAEEEMVLVEEEVVLVREPYPGRKGEWGVQGKEGGN